MKEKPIKKNQTPENVLNVTFVSFHIVLPLFFLKTWSNKKISWFSLYLRKVYDDIIYHDISIIIIAI